MTVWHRTKGLGAHPGAPTPSRTTHNTPPHPNERLPNQPLSQVCPCPMQRAVLGTSVVVVLVAAYFSLSTATTMLGGAKEAKIDSHTEDVAAFAVTQLNAKANFPIQGTLKLGRIVSAKTQVIRAG